MAQVPLNVRANVEVSKGITIGRAVGRMVGRIVACPPPILLASAKSEHTGHTIKGALRNRAPEKQNSGPKGRLCAAPLACQRKRQHTGHHNQRCAAQSRDRITSSGAPASAARWRAHTHTPDKPFARQSHVQDHIEAHAQSTSEPWHRCL